MIGVEALPSWGILADRYAAEWPQCGGKPELLLESISQLIAAVEDTLVSPIEHGRGKSKQGSEGQWSDDSSLEVTVIHPRAEASKPEVTVKVNAITL